MAKDRQRMQLEVPQRYLGPRSLMWCMATINIIVNLAIDMFVPALPVMQSEFGVSEVYLSATLWVFYLFTAGGIVMAGPLTDRRGRRFTMLAGCSLFTLGAFACVLAPSVELLVVARAVQATGFGFVQVAVTAIASDAYAGHSLKFAMSFIQSMTLVGPAVAPFLGAFVIMAAGWRAIFIVLTVAGAVCVALSCLITETLQGERSREGVRALVAVTARKAIGLMRDRAFAGMMFVLGFESLPLSAFVGVSSYIFLVFFQTSYLEYSAAYAVVFMTSILAPYLYLALSKRLSVRSIVRVTLVMIVVTGVCVLVAGERNPVLFVVLFLPCVAAEGIMRPMSYAEMLNQPQELTGAASSLVNFSYWVFFALATVLGTLPWPSFVMGLGVLSLVGAAVAGGFAVMRQRAKSQGA